MSSTARLALLLEVSEVQAAAEDPDEAVGRLDPADSHDDDVALMAIRVLAQG